MAARPIPCAKALRSLEKAYSKKCADLDAAIVALKASRDFAMHVYAHGPIDATDTINQLEQTLRSLEEE